jgi:hypothetical protein
MIKMQKRKEKKKKNFYNFLKDEILLDKAITVMARADYIEVEPNIRLHKFNAELIKFAGK